MSEHYKTRIHTMIDRINARLTIVNNKITEIQGESYGSSNVETCCNNYINKLTEFKTELEKTKNLLETKNAKRLAQLQALEDAKVAWTVEEQTTVDAINVLFENKYSKGLESKLKTANSEERNNFFTYYGEATTDLQREVIIKDYFNIDEYRL